MRSVVPLQARSPRVDATSFEDAKAVTLVAGRLDATFVPGVGMLGVSFRHDGEELLDRQGGLRAYAERGAVMGIPLLHPWANRLAAHRYTLHGRQVRLPHGPPLVHDDEHGLPIHGVLAASPHWRVRCTEADGVCARLDAVLDFAAHPELLATFPFPHELELEAALNASALTITTTVRATGGPPVPVAFGFHPYLRLPADRASCHLTLPARRHLLLDARGIPTGASVRAPASEISLGAESFDDGYDRLEPGAVLSVSGGGRRVSIRLDQGFPVAQVFAPPGAPFAALEPMTAPTNALRTGAGLRRVAPGRSFTARFSIAPEIDPIPGKADHRAV
jgi:galactose mutarotase-like enzyme